jgi:hypothetical protein
MISGMSAPRATALSALVACFFTVVASFALDESPASRPEVSPSTQRSSVACMTKGHCACGGGPTSVIASVTGPLVTTSLPESSIQGKTPCPPCPPTRAPSAREVAIEYKGIKVNFKDPPTWLLIVLVSAGIFGAFLWFVGDKDYRDNWKEGTGKVLAAIAVVGLLVYGGTFAGIRWASRQQKEQESTTKAPTTSEIENVILRAQNDELRRALTSAPTEPARSDSISWLSTTAPLLLGFLMGAFAVLSWSRFARQSRRREPELEYRILDALERMREFEQRILEAIERLNRPS